ncbi:UBA domain-containing Mud1 [Brachionus plicatilis]|uniref:UBA domain-containing Mud1 n=1 Tax=Brachionus plicatilis TaxID=10195 RepID=A0A3M7QI99_BRAPC|nr:UBA domain-containing Mud1 [Brachionus plicatilis]
MEKQRYEGRNNNLSELAHKKCYSCQRYGHLAKYCDFKTRKQSLSSRLLTVPDNNEQTPRQTTATYVKIKINGKNITAALDSGAAKTMISSSLARLIKANPLQNNNRTKWITANGGKLVSKGEIFTRICFGNHSFIQKCEVIDNWASDMLLGTDMLFEQEALIDYKNKQLCFGRTKLPLIIESKQKWKTLLIDDKEFFSMQNKSSMDKWSKTEAFSVAKENDIAKLQSEDKNLKNILKKIDNYGNFNRYSMVDGILIKNYKKYHSKIMLPEVLIPNILQDYYKNEKGKTSLKKTCSKIRQNYIWKNMFTDIKDGLKTRRNGTRENKNFDWKKDFESEKGYKKPGYEQRYNLSKVKSRNMACNGANQNEKRNNNLLRDLRSFETENMKQEFCKQ